MNPAGTGFDEGAEPIEVLSGANSTPQRGLAEIAARIFRKAGQLQVCCEKIRDIVMKAGANTDGTLVDLVKMDSAELDTGFVPLRVQASGSGETQRKQESREGFSRSVKRSLLESTHRRLLGGLVGEIQFVSICKGDFRAGIAAAHIGYRGTVLSRT